MRRAVAAAGVLGLVLTLASCAPSAPTYEEARTETERAMQAIVDTLPQGAEVRDNSGEPFACEIGGGSLLSGDGQFYTGIWVIEQDAGFDGQAFVDELPEKLGDDFVIEDSQVDVSFPAVRLRPADLPEVLISVTTNAAEEDPFVEVRGYSRCGTVPEG